MGYIKNDVIVFTGLMINLEESENWVCFDWVGCDASEMLHASHFPNKKIT